MAKNSLVSSSRVAACWLMGGAIHARARITYRTEHTCTTYKQQNSPNWQWRSQAGHTGARALATSGRLCPISAGAPENDRWRMYRYQSRIGR